MNKSDLNPANNVRDNGMTRRGALQTLAGGIGAGMLATHGKALGATLSKVQAGDSPEVIWSTTLNVEASNGWLPTYYRGIAALVWQGVSDNGGAIVTMDIHSGAFNEVDAEFDGATLGKAVGTGPFIVAPGSDGAIWAVDPHSPQVALRLSERESVVSNLVPWNGYVLYLGASGNLVCIEITSLNTDTTQIIWAAAINVQNAQGAYLMDGGGGSVYVFTDTQLTMVRITNQGAIVAWQVKTAFGAPFGQFSSCDGQSLYVTYSNWVIAYNAADGSQANSQQGLFFYKPQASQLVAYNGYVYYGDSIGNFTARSNSTGQIAWQTTLSGDLTQGIYIEDGIAYACDQKAGIIYALQLDSQGVDFLKFQTGSPYTQIVGVENGLCIVLYGTGGSGNSFEMAGLDMATQINGFACESVLMADNYVATQPETPVYRTRVQLVDPNKNPRVYKSVKVWASDAVTITSGGNSYNIDNNANVAWLLTDAAGELHIISSANDVSAPALYLWGCFMDRQEAIVIYPDHQTSEDLHSATGSTISAAKTYSGTPMLPSGVTGDQVQTAITNVVGAGISSNLTAVKSRNAAVARARHRAALIRAGRAKGRRRLLGLMDANTYVAYPATATNLQYQQAVSSSTRAFVAGPAQNCTATITPGSAITVGPWQQPPSAGLLGGFFSDLVSDVTHGVDAITKITVTVADGFESAAHYIVTAADKVYNLAITTFEDAVAVLGAVLKSVLGDIEKAIEWLSYLFDWEAIKAIQAEISSKVKNFVSDSFPSLVENTLLPQLENIQVIFQEAENKVTTVFTGLQQSLGVLSPKSLQQYTNNNDPKTIFSGGSYAQHGMLVSKLQDNIRSSTVGSLGLLTDGPSLVDLWDQLVTNITQAVGNISSDLQSQLDQFRAAFTNLTTDPTLFVEVSFGAILNLFLNVAKDLATLLLQAANLSIQVILNSIIDLVQGIINLALGQIHIPILSDIFGGGMSFIDLFAWILAVPISIVLRAKNLNKGLVGSVTTEQIYWFCAVMCGALIDALADGVGVQANDPLALMDLAGSIVTYAWGAALTNYSADTAAVAVFVALGVFPSLFSAVAAAVAFAADSSDNEEASIAINKAAPSFWATYGLGMIILSFVFSAEFPATFSDPDFRTAAQNVVGNLDYFMKTYAGTPGGKGLVVTTDVVCPATACILDYFNSGGAS